MNPRRAQMLGEYNRFMGLGDTTPATTTDAAVTTPTAAPLATGALAKYFEENPSMKYVAGAVALAIVYFLWPRDR